MAGKLRTSPYSTSTVVMSTGRHTLNDEFGNEITALHTGRFKMDPGLLQITMQVACLLVLISLFTLSAPQAVPHADQRFYGRREILVHIEVPTLQ